MGLNARRSSRLTRDNSHGVPEASFSGGEMIEMPAHRVNGIRCAASPHVGAGGDQADQVGRGSDQESNELLGLYPLAVAKRRATSFQLMMLKNAAT